jgi:hypothetical protein
MESGCAEGLVTRADLERDGAVPAGHSTADTAGSMTSARPRGAPFGAFLLAATLLGFLCGACFVEWKDTIDPAQVVAGLVRYPDSNPNYLRQVKMFTVVHQASALLLASGMTERTLCRLLSGVEGALLFLAVGLPVFALSKRPILAAGSAFLLVRAFGLTIEGVTYPVLLVGAAPNWGVIGLHFDLIVIGLFAVRRVRAASFCLGMAPAVHPSLGMWLLLALGLVFLIDRRAARETVLRHPAALLAGLLGASAAIGFNFFGHPGYEPKALLHDGRPYLLAEIRLWDAHRIPFSLLDPGMMLLWSGIALILIAFAMGGRSSVAGRYGGVLLASTTLAALGSYGNWYPERLPAWLLIAMPSRAFNLAILGTFGLWIGLLASRRDRVWYQAMLCLSIVALLVQRFHFLLPLLTVAVGSGLDRARPGISLGAWAARALQVTQTILIVAAGWFVCVPRIGELSAPTALGPADDPAIEALRNGSGMVLTGCWISHVQAASRRPVLLRADEIDNFAYTPEAAPAAARVLAEIHGIDFFDPPLELRHTGGLSDETGRALWEQRSARDWAVIGRRWGISTIVTPRDWELRLPRRATGMDLAVYELDALQSP